MQPTAQPTRKLELTDSGIVVESYQMPDGKIMNKRAYTKDELVTLVNQVNTKYQTDIELLNAMLDLYPTE